MYPEAPNRSRSHSPFLKEITVCIDKIKAKRNGPSVASRWRNLRELQAFSKLLHFTFLWPLNWLVERCLGKADFICTPAPKELPLKIHVSLPNPHRQAVSVDRDLKADGGR